jgi:Rps23 Pro-64 3,4-dihydroxylase Tpa1-like proline 4-hydroxylase
MSGGGSGEYASNNRPEDEAPVTIEPILDRMVIFISTMEHEVLPAYAERLTLTTW